MPEAHPAVDEEGVVGARRRLGHGQRGRLGEAVGGAGDEGLEGEARLQAEGPAGATAAGARLAGALVAARRGAGVLGRGRLDDDLDLEVAAAHLEEGVPEQRQVALADPLAQELAVDGEHEAVVGRGRRAGPRRRRTCTSGC